VKAIRLNRLSVALTAGVIVASVATAAQAAWRLPTPGNQTQISQLVAQSTSIKTVPTNLLPPLISAGSDTTVAYYSVTANNCVGPTQCVFGRTTSPRSIFLIGDSHAQMWLPSLVPEASRLGLRIVLEWLPNCPIASVSVTNPATHTPYTACTWFRATAIANVKSMAPLLVLITDRTANVRDTSGALISDAAWQAGEKQTINELKSSRTKVAVIGDITRFNLTLPDCLGVYRTDVQKCSVRNPNPTVHTHIAAERAAALATGVTDFNPQPWLCQSICSPIIGNMVAYYDTGHISATYAVYLSGVWGGVLKHILTT